MAFKTIDEINELRSLAVNAELMGSEWLYGYDAEVLAREYNGIGPEWAGEKFRSVATRHFELFEPAALIHDMRNYVSDGSEESFHKANLEFYRNCILLAKQKYPFWNWKRYRAIAVAQMFFDFVDGPCGWRAWLDCYNKKTPNE